MTVNGSFQPGNPVIPGGAVRWPRICGVLRFFSHSSCEDRGLGRKPRDSDRAFSAGAGRAAPEWAGAAPWSTQA